MDPSPPTPDDPRAAARARFAALIGGPDDDPPLAETALVIALEEYPDLEVRAYLARLHAFTSVLADRVRQAAAGRPQGLLTAAERIAILNQYVFGELGFRGNREAYYDPRNSLLNDVIDRRLGIPLTLALVYMELARGAGLRLAGVGFPGHFLVKTQAVHPPRLLDPFAGGVELGPAEIEERLRGHDTPAAEALRRVDNRAILRRLLTNLKMVYLRQADPERAWHAAARLLLLAPAAPADLLEYGVLCGRIGRYAEGVAALERGIGSLAAGPERAAAEAELAQQRHWLSRLN
jgi:regulator of sirC expression with transglutaminase-like and TPR domain